MMIIRRNPESNLLQFHFVHHQSQMKSPGTEPEALHLEASVYLSYVTSNILNKWLFQFVSIKLPHALLKGCEGAPCTFLTSLDVVGVELLA
jgi:hypothetical protein